MSEQANLFFWNNQNLFSNNYLDYRLPETDLWKGQKDNAAAVFEEISKSYESIKSSKLGPGEEAELEDKFIKPVLSALGYTYHVQVPAKRGAKKEVPDYALFKDNESYKAARKVKDNLDQFFSQSLTILEAKYWGRKLNDADKKDILDSCDPTAQTVKYLDSVNYHTDGRINWAILTNGKFWRLFYFRASSRSGNYFEIDLEEIIKRKDPETFLYFYLYFSKNAFLPDPVSGNTWLDIHLKGAEDYAARVSTKLKDRIFDQVFEGLATGFIHFRHTELGIAQETEESKREIFKGCLTLLYRLLFILYAESRNLLPVNEEGYDKVSLSRLKRDIYQDLKTTGHDKMSMRSSVYWSRLQSLFEIIAKGDPALNVPIYNGGLFETLAGEFLSRHKMPDRFLADAIEQLTVDHEGDTPLPSPLATGGIRGGSFIDYSSLNVRHLGDIYEGLLEFHIQIAEEDIAEIREKGKSVWKKMSEITAGIKTQRLKKTGEVYIENSRHERKATGSYYTPHYIVEYIVKNTVGPVLEARLKTAADLLSQITTVSKTQRKQVSNGSIAVLRNKLDVLEKTLFETTFDIKVLDPAMGSGHFLVHAVDYITDGIVTFLADHPENPVIRKIEELRKEIMENVIAQGVRIDETKLTEVNLIKRMVLKRCIYGVDLNEMAVELAKLSLWLDSFTLGAPLSFLDHHLKNGNSLIGVLDIATVIPVSEIFSEYQRALSFMIQVSELTDATISEAKKSYDLYSQGQKAIEPIRRRFDVATAKYFMDMGNSLKRVEQLAATLDFDKEPYAEIVEKCKRALQIADEKKFFHWRLEFSEVFYTEKTEKENPGFDCVIGNPPYDVLSELEQGRDVEPEKEFFKSVTSYTPALGGKINFYRLFSALSLFFLKDNGRHGFIVPMALLADKQAKSLREFMLQKCSLQKIEAFPQKDDPANRIFKEAKLSTCIYLLRKSRPAQFTVRIHPGKDILESSTSLDFELSLIEEFDKENLSIPCYPNISSRDFQLALKLKKISGDNYLKKIAPSQQGEVNLTEHVKFFSNKENGKIVLRGAHVNRYDFQEDPKQGEPMYLDVDRFLNEHSKDTKSYDYRYIRIGYQRGSAIDNWRRIIATIIEKDNFCSDTINYIVNPKKYDLFAILALLNSSLWEWRFRLTSTNNHVNSYEIDSMLLPPFSFTTPEKEPRKRVAEAIELYEKYMVELEKKGCANEKTEPSAELNRAMGRPVAGGKEGKVSGEHPGAGARVHGVRGRTRKPDDVEGAHEESEEYNPPSRSTRYIESSLGIKSYSELAPYLAKEVERVMASLLEKSPDELKITPEFICGLHRDAFEGLFPSWAGRYRDRNVKVGDYEPPPYFEVPVLMRGYCDDLEFRLSSLAVKQPVPDVLIEALAFAEGRLLSIHPFRDFNGRVTRMLLFALLYRLSLPPVRLVPEKKDGPGLDEYLNALAEADRMNWQPLITIWQKRLGLEEGK